MRKGKGCSNQSKTGWANGLEKAGWRRRTAVLFSSIGEKWSFFVSTELAWPIFRREQPGDDERMDPVAAAGCLLCLAGLRPSTINLPPSLPAPVREFVAAFAPALNSAIISAPPFSAVFLTEPLATAQSHGQDTLR